MDVIDHPRVYLADAMRKVNALLDISLDEDAPSIQAANCSLLFQSNMDTNFNDIIAFKSAFARSADDARVYSQLNSLLEKGQEYAIMLYTWRSISRALPFIRSNEQPHRMEIYKKTVEILEPYAVKLNQFMYFQDAASARFAEEVKRLAHKEQKNFFVNQAYLVTLGKMLKMFALLDEMKNMKASMKNDYSNYKRATQFLQHHDLHAMEESQNVSMFLAKQKIIRDTLKERLNAVDGYEDLLVEIIHNSAQMYEHKVYVLPEEKHTHVIVIAFSLYLLDSSRLVDGKQVGVNVNKLAKRLNIPKLDRILKECEVVNLFGDMSVEPFSYVRQTASFDPSKWPECTGSRVSSQSALLLHMPRFRDEYTSLTSDLAWHTNVTSTRVGERSSRENRELYELALRGLQYLSGWSVQVLDTFTWKLAHCATHETNRQCPKEAESYEKATKYNYNSDERFAMLEVISMIKSVQAQLLRLEAYYSEAIRRSVYRDLQTIVVGQLSGPLVKAQKKKDRINLVRLIYAIQATCADQILDQMDSDSVHPGSGGTHSKSWSRSASSRFNNHSATNNNSLTSGSSSMLASAAASLAAESSGGPGGSVCSANRFDLDKRRRVGPSSSQLYLVRTMLELMIDQTASGRHVMRKELDAHTLNAIENFLKSSFYWPYLLNFSETLLKCCDLSQLWYREFFLEITNGACIQFPIEMSLPWIFTDHILETENPGFIEYTLYPLDLYNDAANCALNRFRRRFLYEEIEAEASLVFDQLVYKLSDQVFKHYKRYAASILLDKRFRAEAQRAAWREAYPSPKRYAAALLRQRHVQLLGRTVDLGRLVAQRMNTAIYKSLEVAISRFHGSDLTGIIELEAAIGCSRLCHRMLSDHLELDDFDALLREANHLVTSPLGKIAVHVFWELTYDVVKNYCYNDATNRFVRTKFTLTEVLEREKPPAVDPQYLWGSQSLTTCFESVFHPYKGFVGSPHFSAICRLLGYRGLYIVITEVMKVAQSLLNQTLRDYVRRLIRAMPRCLQLPPASQGSDATFSALYTQLLQIYQYPDLRTNVCQNFRELGNIIICCLQMEKQLSIEDACDLRHAGPFIGQMPKHFFPLLQDAANKGKLSVELRREGEIQLKELQKKQESMNVVNVIARIGTAEQLNLAKENEILTKERLCSGLVLFEHVLHRIREFLNEEDSGGSTWHGLPNATKGAAGCPVVNDILGLENYSHFHRVWSAIQLVFCTPFGQNEYTVEEMFGEGLNWAGCAIMLLLGQQRRFEILDFGGHLLRLQRADKKDVTTEGVSLEKMAARLSRFAVLNRQIFATLNVYLHPKDRPVSPSETVRHFPPPTWSRS
ncbi:cytoplasmic FMR1 interacting protein [Paragonimus westermani]|uniref:Cytoplasmic FMR1-interacting protein n=1 Tax=Paragonimus westermani TaxID=34504 RepID=A0A5J4P122_9TREM|nr:cytoplasmic FMR1 interacting protein [Paragonimus westermani]